MKHGRHFRRFGGGVFQCAICERSTRLVDQGNDSLCPDCWEVAGHENSILDGHDSVEKVQGYVAEHVRNIEKKGGNMVRFYEQFRTVFPNGPVKTAR
jgi:hypothetical protein